MNLPPISLTISHQRERTGKANRVQVFLARVLLWTHIHHVTSWLLRSGIIVWMVTEYNWKKSLTHIEDRAESVDREGLVNLIPVLTPEYLLPSQWIPVLPPIYSLPLRSDCTKVWNRIYPTRDAPFLGSGRRSFAPSQKWRQNHRSYVRTEVLSSIIFVRTQKQSRLVWT